MEESKTAEEYYQLLYISAAEHEFSEKELEELLKAARENNERLEISGMLLFHKGSFIQALEGKKDDVERLYQNISIDANKARPCEQLHNHRFQTRPREENSNSLHTNVPKCPGQAWQI